MRTLLYQVKATEPTLLILPWMTMLAVALMAALPPVIVAVRIDPLAALRAE